jgi:YidC/Oxa1 family membrane protein insertase
MDRNSITGIVLIGLILDVFSVLNRPSQEEIDAARRRQDSLEIVRQQQLREEARQITREEIADESTCSTDPDTGSGTADLAKQVWRICTGCHR